MKRKTRVKGAVPYEGGVRFGLWAPHATEVFVVGTFNDWNKTSHPLTHHADGWWSADVAGAKVGDEYLFRILAGPSEAFRIDPYARAVTNSVGHGIITKPGAKVTGPFTPPTLNEMVIYELHIGTFGKHGQDGPGNLEGAMERLDHLRDLGINAIEIMPLSEFPGGYS